MKTYLFKEKTDVRTSPDVKDLLYFVSCEINNSKDYSFTLLVKVAPLLDVTEQITTLLESLKPHFVVLQQFFEQFSQILTLKNFYLKHSE